VAVLVNAMACLFHLNEHCEKRLGGCSAITHLTAEYFNNAVVTQLPRCRSLLQAFCALHATLETRRIIFGSQSPNIEDAYRFGIPVRGAG
jgi:hypothetical protein